MPTPPKIPRVVVSKITLQLVTIIMMRGHVSVSIMMRGLGGGFWTGIQGMEAIWSLLKWLPVSITKTLRTSREA